VSHRQKVVWRNARAALLGLGLFCGSAALAQSATSVLTGNVVDAATKAPVADVVVTATSPGLQGEQVVVTDATGLYRVPQLPPGTYTLRFEKESFRPFSRTNIDVAADRTLRLNVELLPETAGVTEISVVGSPPTIDVGSSTTGATVTSEFTKNLAVSRPGGLSGANRSFDSLATVAPQANADVYGVGINGTTSPENLYLIDGLSVNNPAYGTLGSPLTSEFVDEVNIITAGYMPEFGRTTGGAISAVTKSGGNEFHGSIFGTFTPGSLTGPAAEIFSTTRTLQFQVKPHNFGDVGATLGGYIIKDRLWFFAGIQWAAQRYSYERSFSVFDTATQTLTPVPNSTQRVFADERSINYIGKLTFLISADHRLSLSVTGTPTTGGGDKAFAPRGTSNTRGIRTGAALLTGTFNSSWTNTTFDSLDVNGQLNSSFLDKRLLLDIRVGWHHQKDEELPGDDSTDANIDDLSKLAGVPRIQTKNTNTNVYLVDDQVPASVVSACTASATTTCGVTRYNTGGGDFLHSYTFDSYQAKGVLTYLLNAAGHHVLKVGVDAQWNQYKVLTFYSGGQRYRDGIELGLPGTFYTIRGYGHLTDVDTTDGPNPFIRSTVKSTIVGGFVQDSWSIMDKVTLNLGLRYDSLAMKNDKGETGLALNDQWSPRVGVVYDPTQQGRSKIYANYGRYYENIPLDLANRSLSAESQIGGLFDCNPYSQNRLACAASARLDGIANLGLGDEREPTRKWYSIGGALPTAVDENVKSPANDEVVVGGEYEVLPNARAGVSYTYRNLVRTIEDMSNTDGQTYFIGNPGEGIANTFPKAKRTYHAVTASFAKTFADLWLAQFSYTWSRLTGNYDGLFRPEDNQLDPNINSTFDLKNLLLNQDGNLNGDITHFVKAYVAKEWPLAPVVSLTTGLSFNANSGTPINALGAHLLYGAGQAFIVNRGTFGRLPWVTSLDANLGFNYRFSKDMVLTARVEGFNLFNSQRATQVDQNYTTSAVGPIVGVDQGQVPTQYGGICSATVVTPAAAAAATCGQGNGSLPVPRVDPSSPAGNAIRVGLPNAQQQLRSIPTNLGFGHATAYQGVRTFRFSVRVTF
jgi:Carboxypeptidase regulatory-like domain/TonB dependent receptor-like, beta-barrel